MQIKYPLTELMILIIRVEISKERVIHPLTLPQVRQWEIAQLAQVKKRNIRFDNGTNYNHLTNVFKFGIRISKHRIFSIKMNALYFLNK